MTSMQNDDFKFKTILQKAGRLTEDEMSLFLDQSAYGWCVLYDDTHKTSSIGVQEDDIIVQKASKFFDKQFQEAGYLPISWTGNMTAEVWQECYNLGINGPFRNFITNWTHWKQTNYDQWLRARDSSVYNQVIEDNLSNKEEDSKKNYIFKVKHGSVYRRFSCPADLEQIRSLLVGKDSKDNNVLLTYLDDEQDDIVITNNTELVNAIKCATDLGLVRLKVNESI